MNAKIEKVEFVKEFESKFGKLYCFKVGYKVGDNEMTAFYNSKKRDQKKFIAGEEAEFVEETKVGKNGEYYVVKPMYSGGLGGGYSKQTKREQSRYSGFAVSYVKDLIVAEKLDISQWKSASKDIFEFMVALDKSMES